jgi:Gpi18-like mannosyltransferase
MENVCIRNWSTSKILTTYLLHETFRIQTVSFVQDVENMLEENYHLFTVVVVLTERIFISLYLTMYLTIYLCCTMHEAFPFKDTSSGHLPCT